jgi:hypothetical protein
LTLSVLLLSTGVADAQAPKEKRDAPPAAAAGQDVSVPTADALMLLIRTTLIALNQANLTGNYSVLRDIGAPGFQSNSAARIAEAFTNLRQRNIDLSPVLLFQPKLLGPPTLDAKGMLRVTGFFPTQPERVNFDLLFEFVGDQWKLFGMAVDTTQAPPPAASAGQGAGEQAANPNPTQSAPQAQAASPPSTPPAKAKSLPDIRDRVDNLETSPAPAAKPKPKDSYNPLSAF